MSTGWGRSPRRPAPPGGDPDAAPPGDPEQPLGDPETVGREICLRLLTQRARSRHELADALSRRGVPDEPAQRVLDRLTEVGLIDDAALAQTLAAAQHRERGLARSAVAAKLRRHGLDGEVVDAALTAIDAGSERARARELVERRRRSLRALPADVQARRLVGLLARKGYSSGVAYSVVREALAQGDAADTASTAMALELAADDAGSA